MKKTLSRIIFYLFFSILFILFILSIYIKTKFNNVTFDQFLYTINNASGTESSVIINGFFYVAIRFIAIYIFYFLILFILNKLGYTYIIKISYKNKKLKLSLFPLTKKFKRILIIFLVIIISFLTLKNFRIREYIKQVTNYSNIFEEYYVDPKDVNIKFPDDKKNLIFIYVESLESSSVSKSNGGAFKTSIIPNLEQLAIENTNFSNTKKVGGAYQLNGTSWTAGAMVGASMGIPLKVPMDANKFNLKNGFLPGAYSIGEILSKNGYNNYIMFGSEAKFAGRNILYKQHGNYKIYDYNWGKKEGAIDNNYKEWWGYEDSKLFEFAKEKLIDIALNEEPFNFTILTADTHFPDGYVDKACKEVFSDHYKNSFYCSDYIIKSFIDWVKEQDFYDDTVVIIVGDHLTMQEGFYNEVDDKYRRTIYNSIINSNIEEGNIKNRIFTTLDLYPTTLATLGCNIKGNQLGLGVNLYSNKKTLSEKLGFDYFNDELSKNSKFYNNTLLGYENYYKLQNSK